MHSFKDMTISIFFVDLAWNAYSRPQNFGFLGVRTIIIETTKRHILGLTCQFWWRSVHRCDLGGCWRNQKKRKKRKKGEERNLQWQTGCSPRPPTLTQRLWSCMPDGLRGVVISFKFRQNWLNGFRDVGRGRNLPFPILKASGLL